MLGYAWRAVSMLFGLLFVRLALDAAGPAQYGAFVVIASVTSFLTLAEGGLGAGLRNKLAHALTVSDRNGAASLVANAYLQIAVASILVGAVAILLTFVLPWKEWLKLTGVGDARLLQLAMVVSLAGTMLGLLTGVINAVAAAQNIPSIQAMSSAIAAMLSCVLVYVAVLYGPDGAGGVLVPVLATAAGLLLANLFISGWVFKKTPWLVPNLRHASTRAGMELMSFGGKIFLINIAVYVLGATSNLVATNILGPDAVTQVSVVNRLFLILQTVFGTIVFSSITPMVQARASGDWPWLHRLNRRILHVGLFMSVVAIGVAALHRPLFHLWLSNPPPLPVGLVWAQCAVTVISFWNNVFATALTALEHLRAALWCALAAVVLNIVFAFGLVGPFGVAGIVAANFIALLPSAFILPLAFTAAAPAGGRQQK